MKHEAADALLRLRTTGVDETPIQDDIPGLFITLSHPPIEEAAFMYMQEDDAERDQGGVRLPNVYPLAKETGGQDQTDRSQRKRS